MRNAAVVKHEGLGFSFERITAQYQNGFIHTDNVFGFYPIFDIPIIMVESPIYEERNCFIIENQPDKPGLFLAAIDLFGTHRQETPSALWENS